MGYLWACYQNDANEPALGWGGSYQQDDDVDGGKGVCKVFSPFVIDGWLSVAMKILLLETALVLLAILLQKFEFLLMQ